MFDYVNFSSPFFSFDRSYCIDLCESIIRHKLSIKWKCVTKPDYLDKDLIYLMSKAGCKATRKQLPLPWSPAMGQPNFQAWEQDGVQA